MRAGDTRGAGLGVVLVVVADLRPQRAGLGQQVREQRLELRGAADDARAPSGIQAARRQVQPAGARREGPGCDELLGGQRARVEQPLVVAERLLVETDAPQRLGEHEAQGVVVGRERDGRAQPSRRSGFIRAAASAGAAATHDQMQIATHTTAIGPATASRPAARRPTSTTTRGDPRLCGSEAAEEAHRPVERALEALREARAVGGPRVLGLQPHGLAEALGGARDRPAIEGECAEHPVAVGGLRVVREQLGRQPLGLGRVVAQVGVVELRRAGRRASRGPTPAPRR